MSCICIQNKTAILMLIVTVLIVAIGSFAELSGCHCVYGKTSEGVPDDFITVSEVVPDAVLDIRYYSNYNFTGKRVDGYLAPKPYLTLPAAKALARAADELRKQGYRIVIYDTYRPQKAVTNFVRWINDPNDPGNRSFYPRTTKDKLLAGGFIDARSGHSRGSVVDLSIVHMDGTSVDMGGMFDLFDEISHPDSKSITPEQRANRQILNKAMTSAGFTRLETEWWHFLLKNEPYPNTYFDFDIK